jgi:uncharacterized protein (DUF433 family)
LNTLFTKSRGTSSGGNTSSQNFTSVVSVYDDESAGVVQIQIAESVQLLNGINKTPNVVGGNARIRNTRIPVWSLVQAHQMGANDLELLEAHPELTQTNLD